MILMTRIRRQEVDEKIDVHRTLRVNVEATLEQ